jgi:hypothetical protein
MDTIVAALGRDLPSSTVIGVFVSNLQEYLGREARPGLRLLMGVVLAFAALDASHIAAATTSTNVRPCPGPYVRRVGATIMAANCTKMPRVMDRRQPMRRFAFAFTTMALRFE